MPVHPQERRQPLVNLALAIAMREKRAFSRHAQAHGSLHEA